MLAVVRGRAERPLQAREPEHRHEGVEEVVEADRLGGVRVALQRRRRLVDGDRLGAPLGHPPDGGGATLFSSMYSAYEALSPAFQEFLDGRVALHQLGNLPGHR